VYGPPTGYGPGPVQSAAGTPVYGPATGAPAYGQASPEYGQPDDYAYDSQAYVRQLDVGRALGYGWRKFQGNLAPWLGVSGVVLGIWVLYMIAVTIIDNSSTAQVLITIFLFVAAVWMLQACMIRGALYELDGARPDFASFFRFMNPGAVLLTAILVFLAATVGFLLAVIPCIVVLLACIFVLQFAIDQHLDPIASVVASARLASSSVLQVVLLALAVGAMTLIWPLLAAAAISIAGPLGMIFALGLAFTGPISLIATTYAYRVLIQGTVAG
jgi:uncharacterized membrane protein